MKSNKFGSSAEVAEFITDLETSARKILKKANKKKMEAARLEQVLSLRKENEKATSKTPKGISHTGTILISNHDLNQSKMSKSLDYSKDTTFQNKLSSPTLSLMNKSTDHTLDTTSIMNYSVPKMIVTMSTDKGDSFDSQLLRSLSAGGNGAVQLSPIRTRNYSMTSPRKEKGSVASRAGLKDVSATSSPSVSVAKRNKILEKIESSPFLPSTVSSTDILKASTRKQAKMEVDAESDAFTAPMKDSEGHTQLRLRATEILAGKQSTNSARIQMYAQRQAAQRGRAVEAQGPIDWSSRGLRAKYRGEAEREEAWQAWRMAYAQSLNLSQATDESTEELFEGGSGFGLSSRGLPTGVFSRGSVASHSPPRSRRQRSSGADTEVASTIGGDLVLPVARVDRHPIYSLFFKYVALENKRSAARSEARLRMKRFVFDVQEIWLTNLQHLHEHMSSGSQAQTQPPSPGTDASLAAEQLSQAILTHASEDSDTSLTLGNSAMAPRSAPDARGGSRKTQKRVKTSGRYGLKDRRDARAISSLSFQIQSVSAKRATQKYLHTTRTGEPTVALDFVPKPCPVLQAPPPLPFVMHSLLEEFPAPVQNEGGLGSVRGHQYPVRLFLHRLLPPLAEADTVPVTWRILALQQENAAIATATLTEEAIWRYVSEALRQQTLMEESEGVVQESRRTSRGGSWASGDKDVFEEEFWRNPVPVPMLWLQHDLETDISVGILRRRSNKNTPVDDAQETRDGAGMVVGVCVHVVVESHGVHLTRTLPIHTLRSLLRMPATPPPVDNFDQRLASEVDATAFMWEGSEEGERVHGPRGLVVGPGWCQRLVSLLTFLHEDHHQWNPEEETSRGVLPKVLAISGDWPLASPPSEDATPSLAPLVLTGEQACALAMEFVGRIQVFRQPVSQEGSAQVAEGLGAPLSFKLQPLSQTGELSQPQSLVIAQGVGGDWEGVSDRVLPLSMRISGFQDRMNRVPGSCLIGRAEQSFNVSPPIMEEGHAVIVNKPMTWAAGNFFRDSRLSSTDSVLVTTVLALDSPCLLNAVLAWEPDSMEPSRTPHEECDSVVPMRVARPVALLSTALQNPLEDRLATTVAVFSAIAEERVDFMVLTHVSPPPGMARAWPERDFHGFRRKVVVPLLGVDPVLPTQVFGVTKQGALPNTTAVHTRNIWHSTFILTDPVNRPRLAGDMHYILHNEFSRGPNDPATFVVRLRDGLFFALDCSALRAQQAEHDEILRRRAAYAKQLAMEMKIENAEVILRAKDKEREVLLRRREQRAMERKLNQSSRIEKGWARRMQLSTLVELQGQWERRRDDRTQMYFFHYLSGAGEGRRERFSSTCQWEVPTIWEGDPLADGSVALQDTAFMAPSEVWLPGSGVDTEKTRGVLPRGVRRAKKGDQVGPVIRSMPAVEEFSEDEEGSEEEEGDDGATSDGGDEEVVEASVVDATEKRRIERELLKRLAGDSEELLALLTKQLGLDKADGEGQGSAPREGSKVSQEVARPRRLSKAPDGASAAVAGLRKESTQLPSHKPRKKSGAEATTGASGAVSSALVLAGDSHREVGGSTPPQLRQRLRSDSADYEDDELNRGALDSDEDFWSDEEQEAGDLGEKAVKMIGETPQSHADVAKLRIASQREGLPTVLGATAKKSRFGAELDFDRVPVLDIEGKVIAEQLAAEDAKVEAGGFHEQGVGKKGVRGLGWRKLPRPDVATKFFERCTKTHTMEPDGRNANVSNSPLFLSPISPVDACEYEPVVVQVPIETIFIPDARGDLERVTLMVDRLIKMEEALAQPLSTAELLQQTLDGRDNSTEMAKRVLNQQKKNSDRNTHAIEKAILAAKSADLAQLEDALEEDISVESADPNGNTLLILAAQQGSKRVCKFLLRRGANINAQSRSGNTALHYCWAYSHHELADYFKRKGANDSVLNAAGLTCYEGLNSDQLVENYG